MNFLMFNLNLFFIGVVMPKAKLTKKKNSWEKRGRTVTTKGGKPYVIKSPSTGSKPPDVEFGESRLVELAVTQTLASSMPKQSQFAYPVGDWTKGVEDGCPLYKTLKKQGHKNPVEALQKVYRDAIDQFRSVSTDDNLLKQTMEQDETARCFVSGEGQDLLVNVLSWTNLCQDNSLAEYWTKVGAAASFDFALKGVPADLKMHDVRVPSRFLRNDGRARSPREAVKVFVDRCTLEFAQGWGSVLTMYLMSLGLPVLAVLTNGEHLCVINLTKWYQYTNSFRDNRRRSFYWNEWVAETLGIYGLDNVVESLGDNSGERAGFTYRNTSYDKDTSESSHSCLPRVVKDGKSNGPRLRVSVSDFRTPSGQPVVKKDGVMSTNSLDILTAPDKCSPLMRVKDLAGWLPNLKDIL
jgi:hypothetical protein